VFSVAPATAMFASPARGQTYRIGQTVPTRFSCADAAYAPGIRSCTDSNGSTTGSGHLRTSTVGSHIYTVTAVSKDGLSAKASIGYTVLSCTNAYNAGFNAGYQRGFHRGFLLGFQAATGQAGGPRGPLGRGCEAGIAQACGPTFTRAFNTGFHRGFDRGFTVGFSRGFHAGYQANRRRRAR